MNIYEFKTLWAWCSSAPNDEDFWARWMIATAAYPAPVRTRLIKFAWELWYG